MDIICSICGESHDSTLSCSGCMGRRVRDPRIPLGIDTRGYDLDDWRYFQLLELVLAGEELNDHEYKFLQVQPTQILTRKEAEEMRDKRIEYIQAKAKERREKDRAAADREAKRKSYRLF